MPLTTAPDDVFVVPASSGQQRLWFLDRYLNAGAAYNVCQAYRLRGAVDARALASALDAIVARHETLRTGFRMVSGELHQVISPTLHVALGEVSAPDADAVDAALTREATTPFDLTTAPLVRLTLLHVNPTETVLVITAHHIVVDGWSMKNFLEELSSLYRASVRGGSAALPELAVQYADFAMWEREVLKQPVNAGLTFWRERLSSSLAPLDIPTDRRRPTTLSTSGHVLRFSIGGAITAATNATARGEGGSFFAAALTALAAVVHRYTGAELVLIGGPIANRMRPELESAIGFFANTVVFRADLTGDPTFRELFGRVKAESIGVLAHQDTPFDLVVRSLQPDRATDRNPIFQVALAYQRQPDVMLALDGLTVTPVEVSTHTAKFDILLDLQEYGDRTDAVIELSADLFDASTAERLRDHFINAVTTFATQPDTRVSTFAMLSDLERRNATDRWNRRDSYAVTTIPALFEERAAEAPDAVAIVHDGRACSYAELNARANQVAAALADEGVVKGDLVAIRLEPSVDLIAAIVGVVKAGAAYLPIDATYPADRVAFTLADADVRAMVTTSVLAEEGGGRPLLLMDRDHAALAAQPAGNRQVMVDPGDRAYVIYTSGSTGRPKGVEVTHANVTRLFTATDEWFGFTRDDVWTMFHSAAFDFSVWEIWGALLYGGRLVIVPHDVSRSPMAFHALLGEHGVTVLNQTPSALKQLIDADQMAGHARPLSLRYIVLGGEALDLQSLAPWFAKHGDEAPRVINMYGITETTVHVTYRPITLADLAAGSGSVIGEPIHDLQIYLLDRHRQLVPVGVPGEIHVGGAGVARGYLNRPELTADRFVADPYRAAGAGALYRSGDLAKRLPNGDLEYLGRIDHQIKIRGFRVELGEIENVIREDDGVRDVAVIAREDQPGDVRLVAYVVSSGRDGSQDTTAVSDRDHTQVDEWQAVFERTYTQPAATDDPAFNIVGWNSSYTRLPLPAAEMREWLADTIDRISALGPSRVWEIGCGTGMILYRVAPAAAKYVGTDLSPTAVARLRAAGVPASAEVELRPAHEGTSAPPRSFDTVVINSVAQYFPSVHYLLTVLETAVEAVADGGRIFVGDVRNLESLEAFHASVQAFGAEASLSARELSERVRRAVAQEQELVLAPDFFRALPSRFPRVTNVELHVKKGRASNELNAFRYDVVLHVGGPRPALPEPIEIEWTDTVTSLEMIRSTVAGATAAVHVRQVPNRRVARDVALASTLSTAGEGATAGSVTTAAETMATPAVDPVEFLAIADATGASAHVTWSQAGRPDRIDVWFTPKSVPPQGPAPEPVVEPTDPAFWDRVSTNPAAATFARDVVPRLRQHLRDQLPEHMMPWAFVPLAALPLTANGKLDRRALPKPVQSAVDRTAYVEPRDQIERTLAGIWSDVLGTSRIGVHDDFFELGGHSILAGRVTSRVRSTLGVELSFADVFTNSTIDALAAILRPKVQDGGPKDRIGRAARRTPAPRP